MMYATSNFLTSIGFNVPHVFTVVGQAMRMSINYLMTVLQDRALEWGMDGKQAAFLLSVIGIANTIGRIILGWLSDREEINSLYLYNSCMGVCGVSMGLSVFCNTYISQAVGATSSLPNLGFTKPHLYHTLILPRGSRNNRKEAE
jgi:MCP family monocarboxylic acid transporter-like MFS transporter 14